MAASALDVAAAANPTATEVKFADADHFDPEWLQGVLGISQTIASAKLEAMEGTGGLSGLMRRATVVLEDGSNFGTLVLKTTAPGNEALAKSLGLDREALFAQTMLPSLSRTVGCPRTYAASVDAKDGSKAILMEDLGAHIQSGYLFGPGSPHNHGVDLDAAVAAAGGVSPQRVAAAAFLNAARLHSAYWQSDKLLEFSWLRGVEWPQGKGRESWQATIDALCSMWATGKAKIESGEQTWWHPDVVAMIDASIAKASWEDNVERLRTKPWTLAHGDFHPANMMWRVAPEGETSAGATDGKVSREVALEDVKRIVLLDFEQLGVGSGPQDLGQYVISHMDPAVRREHEDDLLRLYHDELGRGGVDTATFTLEDCRKEYAHGALERWVWLLGYMAGCCPEAINRYLHDQVHAFMVDFGIDASNIGQPRC